MLESLAEGIFSSPSTSKANQRNKTGIKRLKRTFTPEQKLEAVEYAGIYGKKEAAKNFKVLDVIISRWIKNKSEIEEKRLAKYLKSIGTTNETE